MADQPGKRRGRPRKVVPDAERPVESQGSPASVDGNGPSDSEKVARREGPADWSGALERLSRISGVVTGISVPFDVFPELYETPHYGAPVRRGESFAVTLADGTKIG
jgi:hypothetical protein